MLIEHVWQPTNGVFKYVPAWPVRGSIKPGVLKHDIREKYEHFILKSIFSIKAQVIYMYNVHSSWSLLIKMYHFW